MCEQNRLASIHGKLKALDEWLRNRLRYCIWTDGDAEFGKSQSVNERTLLDLV
jgi:hypothetical protein